MTNPSSLPPRGYLPLAVAVAASDLDGVADLVAWLKMSRRPPADGPDVMETPGAIPLLPAMRLQQDVYAWAHAAGDVGAGRG